jgi:stress-induced-phosphoprotein 1
LDASNAVLYSNRSAAEASLGLWESALRDAEMAIELKPAWSKGYGRRGAALIGLGEHERAIEAYERGLEIEPENAQLKQGLETARKNLERRTEGPASSNPFSDPKLVARLTTNPRTAAFFGQPDFLAKLAAIQKDPQSLAQHISDPRIMQALGVMLGVDISEGEAKKEQEEEEGVREPKGQQKETGEPMPGQQKQMGPEEEAAAREKELGNEAYKKRDFGTAIAHYEAAMKLDPRSASFVANKSAALFEAGRMEECIAACEEAIRLGRETYADFKFIAKLFARQGGAYERLGDLDRAIQAYGSSLTEARNPEVHERLRAAEKARVQREKEAMHDPAGAERERALGNDAFKAGDYATAVKHYSEAIRKDEKDPRAYSNRAACYLKLAAIPEGLKDADRAIELDPSFVKGYLRRAALEFAKQDHQAAIKTCERGMAVEGGDGKHRAEFQAQIAKCFQAMSKAAGGGDASGTDEERAARAMANPEVQEILADPAMRVILKQMEADPRAAAEHLKNPAVAAKIRTLITAGIIRTQ